MIRRPPPTDKGVRLKVFYGTQAGVKPPTFVLFVNEPKLMHYSYLTGTSKISYVRLWIHRDTDPYAATPPQA